MFVISPTPCALKKSLYCTILVLILSGCTKEPEKTSSTDQSTTNNIPARFNNFHPLKDTGITWAGKFPKHNQQDCSPQPQGDNVSDIKEKDLTIYQDCMHGADKSKVVASYQKLNNVGEALDAAAPIWSCVLDNSTGLLWESKKTMDGTYGNSGPEDADDVFTWYSNNSANNGGAVGDWGQGLNVCAGYVADLPATFCNTEEFTRRVNEKGLCGYKDWRLPTRFELESLLNYGNQSPLIDTTYFPDINSEFYWSSTPGINPGTAWVVNFRTGNTSLTSRQSSFPLRLVRGGN